MLVLLMMMLVMPIIIMITIMSGTSTIMAAVLYYSIRGCGHTYRRKVIAAARMIAQPVYHLSLPGKTENG